MDAFFVSSKKKSIQITQSYSFLSPLTMRGSMLRWCMLLKRFIQVLEYWKSQRTIFCPCVSAFNSTKPHSSWVTVPSFLKTFNEWTTKSIRNKNVCKEDMKNSILLAIKDFNVLDCNNHIVKLQNPTDSKQKPSY